MSEKSENDMFLESKIIVIILESISSFCFLCFFDFSALFNFNQYRTMI